MRTSTSSIFQPGPPCGEIILRLPKAVPTVNQWTYKHWSAYARIKTSWYKLISLTLQATGYARMLHVEAPYARVTIIRRGKRRLDPDNLVAGCKPILDILRADRRRGPPGRRVKSLGLFLDDSPDRMELTVLQEPLSLGELENTSIHIELFSDPD